VFELLRLLPRSDHDKDTEILILRHQIAVPQHRRAAAPIRPPNASNSSPPTGHRWPPRCAHSSQVEIQYPYRIPARSPTLVREAR
jgi:hypothetical protein